METKHQQSPTLAQLKAAIPAKCFESSLTTSLLYLARDIFYATVLVCLALKIDDIPSQPARVLAWTIYMFAQGCVGTGIWILGHECGHGAFSKYGKVNNFLGWLLHSVVLVPYYSWKITHARHHRYTGHITKDAVFVPETEEELKAGNGSRLKQLLDMAEETPIFTLARLLQHQLIGWQVYLLFNLTAGKDSLPTNDKTNSRKDMSHFTTTSQLFLPNQKLLVILSDIGLLCTLGSLWLVAQNLGYWKVALLYFGPYFWVHHWLGEFYLLLVELADRSLIRSDFQWPSHISITHTQMCPTIPTKHGPLPKARLARLIGPLDSSADTSSTRSSTIILCITFSPESPSTTQKRLQRRYSLCWVPNTYRPKMSLSYGHSIRRSNLATTSPRNGVLRALPAAESFSGL